MAEASRRRAELALGAPRAEHGAELALGAPRAERGAELALGGPRAEGGAELALGAPRAEGGAELALGGPRAGAAAGDVGGGDPRRFGLGLSLVFAALFAVVYGGAAVLTPLIPYRIHVDLPFERALPFVPGLAPLYLSIVPVLLAAPWLLARREMLALFLTLSSETLVAGISFLLLPVEGGFPPSHAGGLFAVADALNLEHNWLPSLHVAFAVTAACVYGLGRRAAVRRGLLGWAAAVATSTVFLHQHHLADVVAGAFLGAGALALVYRPASQPPGSEALVVEALAAREMARFGRRHRRYWVIAAAIYGASVGRFRRRRALRTGFTVLQLVDDLLDGDRPCAGEPLDVTDALVAEIERRRFGGAPLSRLAAALVVDLEPLAGPDRDPVAEVVELIRTMQVDRRRVLEGRLLSAEELREQLRRTFRLSLDLMLVALGSRFRAEAAPELVDALGWCSVERDLREDLEAGLVNVPREVVEQAEREGARDRGYESLVATPAVARWREEERARAVPLARRAIDRLEREGDRVAASVLLRFARSVARWAETGRG